jgi:hypothetical protein
VDKENILYMEYYLSTKKNKIMLLVGKMDGKGDYHVK